MLLRHAPSLSVMIKQLCCVYVDHVELTPYSARNYNDTSFGVKGSRETQGTSAGDASEVKPSSLVCKLQPSHDPVLLAGFEAGACTCPLMRLPE